MKRTARLKAAAIDLDGTLLRSDRRVSVYTMQTLCLARAEGLIVIIVTARHYQEVTAIAHALDLSGSVICCSGAALYDLPSGTLVRADRLSRTTIAVIFEEIVAENPDVSFGWVDEDGITYQADYPGVPAEETVPSGSVPEGSVLKAFAMGLGPTRENIPGLADRVIRGRAAIGHRTRGFVDLVHPQASKLRALKDWCAAEQVERSEVVAFGDSYGDIPMMRWAGIGVGMANAGQEVRASADLIADSCDRDGVAKTLRELM